MLLVGAGKPLIARRSWVLALPRVSLPAFAKH
jgi:hypothetical protein